MRTPAAAVLIAATAVGGCLPFALACRPRTQAPAWVRTAPADSVAAVSGQAAWILTHPEVRALLSRDPAVDRALDLFLQKARINPRTETGRVTLHLVGHPPAEGEGPGKALELALVQLQDFRDPAALVAALAEAFPQEGSLRIQGRDWPLHVILDVQAGAVKAHIRAASDEKGQVWIGSLEGLNRMAAKPALGTQEEMALAAEWINPKAPFQGYLQPEILLSGLRKGLEGVVTQELPRGVKALFWSVTPGDTRDQPVRFELAMSGTPEGITQVAPWIQRLVAVANTVQAAPGATPELMQEKRRVGLRCALTPEQLKLVMEKLGQPSVNLLQAPGGRRA